MNLFFLLIFLRILVSFRSKVSILGPCRTSFRCWPTDLDVLRHMNNGIYFSLLDLARVDLLGRSGLLSKLSQNGWYPVVVAETMKFRRSIELFEEFEIESTVLVGIRKLLSCAKVLSEKITSLFAEAIVRARFVKKSGGSVMPKQILDLAEIHHESMVLENWIANWNEKQV